MYVYNLILYETVGAIIALVKLKIIEAKKELEGVALMNSPLIHSLETEI